MKFRRKGVKREHSIIAEFTAVFEELARLDGVTGVIPGRIANNPTAHPGLVLKNETATGFKLLAKTRTAIQEVFVICKAGQRPAVVRAIEPHLVRPSSKPPAGRDARRVKASKSLPQRSTRAVLPAPRWQGEPVRYSADPHPRAPRHPLTTDPGTYRRLYVLRLRRSRWRRRYGVPSRRVHRPRAGG